MMLKKLIITKDGNKFKLELKEWPRLLKPLSDAPLNHFVKLSGSFYINIKTGYRYRKL